MATLLKASNDPNVALTRGYTQGLASLNKTITLHFLPQIITCLTLNCRKKKGAADDAETRKFAVKALSSITKTVGIWNLGKDQLKKIFDVFFRTIDDYTLDKRGDIGLFTREATMYAIVDFLQMAGDCLQSEREDKGGIYEVITAVLIRRCICVILKQLVEKIDRVRLVAGAVL